MPQSEIDRLSFYYQNKDYESMLGNNYKIVFVDIKFIENSLPDDFIIIDKSKAGEDITKQKVLDILTGKSTLELPKSVGDSSNSIKNLLFIASFTAVIKEKGPIYLFKSLKNGYIRVYKEPFSVKLIKEIS
jgi:hypothetical protein